MKKGTTDNSGQAFDLFCPELGAALEKYNNAPREDETATNLTKLFHECQELQTSLYGYVRGKAKDVQEAQAIYTMVLYVFSVWVMDLHLPIKDLWFFLKKRTHYARETYSLFQYVKAYNDCPSEENARALVEEASKSKCISNIIIGMIRKKTESAQIAHELYFVVMGNFYKKLLPPASLKIACICSYLIRCAKNELVAWDKYNERYQGDLFFPENLVYPEETHSSILDNPHSRRTIIRFFKTFMEPRELEAWLLFHRAEYNCDEIASFMGVCPERVRNLLSQAKRKNKAHRDDILNLLSDLGLD